MRVKSTQRQRRWNNILILGIVAFMVLLSAPKLIQTYLIGSSEVPAEEAQASSEDALYPKLLDPNHTLEALYFNGTELKLVEEQWISNLNIKGVPVEELIARWRSLEGTLIEDDIFDALLPSLESPETIEVWYRGVDAPHRIIFYRRDDFWLLQNWQEQWIAISLDVEYLTP